MSKKYAPLVTTPVSPDKKFEKTLATLILYYKERFVKNGEIILNLSYSPSAITLYGTSIENGIEIRNHNITRETFKKIITMNYEVRPKYPSSDIIQVNYYIPKNVIPDTTIIYTISGILDVLSCIRH